MTIQAFDFLSGFGLKEFPPHWGAIRRGIEKESLRITPRGHLAQTSHPQGLGSALTNPYVTTDFSEALLEFITPATTSVEECFKWLQAIHRFTYRHLSDEERLWVCSMPCPLDAEDSIPLARYGSSNIGRLKTLYRKGLSNRYGRYMQAIAGIHYNFSMSDEFWPEYQQLSQDRGPLDDFRTRGYLQLIRNFHRYSWLLIYLFGASPAACKCFVQGRSHRLQELDPGSLYLPDATCLRMSDLGYRSEAQKSIFVCYNDLSSYLESLNKALHTPYEAYEKIGQRANGEYLQINTNLLQLENEFYSSIRPKRVVGRGERPITALSRDGIEYVEVRALDLNPFLPLGIDEEQIRFLDAFLLYCLLQESPNCSEQEYRQIAWNTALVVEQGRDPALKLVRNGDKVTMREWGTELLDRIEIMSQLLDSSKSMTAHSESLAAQRRKLADPLLTPSGTMLELMRAEGLSFFQFGMQRSAEHLDQFSGDNSDIPFADILERASQESVLEQKQIEASDSLDFDSFLAEWNKF